MKIDMVIYGIIGIIAINLIFLFIIQSKKVDRNLKNYLKNHNKE